MRGRMMEPVDIRRILGIQDKPQFSTRLYRWLCREPQSIITTALIGLGCAAVCLQRGECGQDHPAERDQPGTLRAAGGAGVRDHPGGADGVSEGGGRCEVFGAAAE